jgi:hypothetical protein
MNYLIRKEAIAGCLSRLRQRKTHEHFAGYLCLQHKAAALGSNTNLNPNFVRFFDEFFRVDGSPKGAPYVKPFIQTLPSESNLWLNKNVAGSYAPSSIRSTLKRVVNVENGVYSLRENHAQLALEHLLFGVKLNSYDLAIFLYRDYALLDKPSGLDDFLEAFETEFGYKTPEGNLNADYETLFIKDEPPSLTSACIYNYESD